MATNSNPHLTRGLGLLHATALNMSNMVGVGPFITIPLLMATMGGPQAMLGWIFGALLAICDGLVWAELGSAMPGSGGCYRGPFTVALCSRCSRKSKAFELA